MLRDKDVQCYYYDGNTLKPMPEFKPQFGFIINGWHEWFAWYPVRTFDLRWVWLRKIYRAGVQRSDHINGGSAFWFIYSYGQ